MDFLTTDLGVVKAENAHRHGAGRRERKGPPSSLAILLRTRAAERARADGSALRTWR